MLFNDVDEFALYVGEALLYQGRLDHFARHRRELELGKLVGVFPCARPDPDHLVQHVNRGNGNDALLVFSQRRERVIP